MYTKRIVQSICKTKEFKFNSFNIRNRFFSDHKKENFDSRTRGPITFYSLAFAGITGLGIVGLYLIEKDRKTKTLAKNVTSVGNVNCII